MKKMLLWLMGVLGVLCVAGEPVIILEQPLSENSIFNERTPLFIPGQQPIACSDECKAWAHDVLCFQGSRRAPQGDEASVREQIKNRYKCAFRFLYFEPLCAVGLSAIVLGVSACVDGGIPWLLLTLPATNVVTPWSCSCVSSKCPCEYTVTDVERVKKAKKVFKEVHPCKCCCPGWMSE